MPVQYLKLLFRVFVSLLNVVLNLLDEFVIRLVGIAGVATLIRQSTA